MSKLNSTNKDVINIYRPTGANDEDFMRDIKDLINLTKETLILGDLNICYINERSNLIIKSLEEMGFVQHVKNPSHIEGRLIDHAYSFSPTLKANYEVKQQAQYFTDHDLIQIRKCPSKAGNRLRRL